MRYKYPSEIYEHFLSSTKEDERYVLDIFFDRLDLNNLAKYIEASECPDFDCRMNGKYYGIELTNYYVDSEANGSHGKMFIYDWFEFAKKLNHELKLRGLNYIFGSISWKNTSDDFKDECFKEQVKTIKDPEFMKQLIELVSERYSKVKDRLSLSLDRLNNYHLLDEHLSNISLDYTFPDKEVLWWHTSLKAHKVKNPLEALKKIVAHKDEKSRAYRIGFDEKWLIIFSHGLFLSDLLYLHDTALEDYQKLEVENFDKVFVFSKRFEEIHLIYPEPIKIFSYKAREVFLDRRFLE